jgi:hydroxymethylbilane synthase
VAAAAPPIAALDIVSNDALKLSGMVASIDGTHILHTAVEGDVQAPEQVGKQLAQKMVEMGALSCISELKSL